MKMTIVKLPQIFSTTLFSLVAGLILSCGNPKNEEKNKVQQKTENKIDLLVGATPKTFSAKTTTGMAFKSDVNKGKYWIIFVYDQSYLTKSETYDLVLELNRTHKRFGDKIPMIGIINGFCDDDQALQKILANSKINFSQIDNTQGPGKEAQIDDNVFCTPAKILIGPEGKVLYNGCGGGSEKLDEMLDDLLTADKRK